MQVIADRLRATGQLTYIYEDVHSPEQLDSLRDRPLTRLFVCDISLNSLGNPAFRIDHALRFLHPLEVVVEERDLGAMSGEEDCGRSAVANFALRKGNQYSMPRYLLEDSHFG